MGNKAASTYSQVGNQSARCESDPYKIVQMLMQGALDKIALAKGHITRGETELKGLSISVAISIIEGLQHSLDKELGGEIAKNLDDLYSYSINTLLTANHNNDTKLLDDVAKVLSTIKEGWDGIPESKRQLPPSVGAP